MIPRMSLILSSVLLLLLLPAARADEGNGLGLAYLSVTAATIGGTFTVEWGAQGQALANSVLVISDGFGPAMHPQVGSICLNIFSPTFGIVAAGPLGPNGSAMLSAAIPANPSLVGVASVYLLAAVVDPSLPGALSITKTARVHFENPGGYNPTAGALSTPRGLHSATPLYDDSRDNRQKVFIAGGGNGNLLSPVATSTTEFYDPLSNTFGPGPNMGIERALHQAVKLNDGRVLLIGGADTAGIVTAGCEAFDPVTGSISPVASMNAARAGHEATLPGGSVLVTGGVTTFVGGSTGLAAVLNTAQDTAEVYDPVNNVWMLTSNPMSASRFVHRQILRSSSGTVLVTGGIDGGITFLGQDAPTFTSSVDNYDPATNSFSAGPTMSPPRAGHGLSELPNGDVLMCGGIVTGLLFIPTATANCQVLGPAGWTGTASLQGGAALHTQVVLPSGDVFIAGGINGTLITVGATSKAGIHDGANFTPTADIGIDPGLLGGPSPRGSHTLTSLPDGSWLLVGGADSVGGLASAYLWTP